jgi:hypothetical protein
VPEKAHGAAPTPSIDDIGWHIIETFATSDMTQPDAEKALQTALRDLYSAAYWEQPLRMVTEFEPDCRSSDKAAPPNKQM